MTAAINKVVESPSRGQEPGRTLPAEDCSGRQSQRRQVGDLQCAYGLKR